jgi:nicotinamide riboside kinase
MTSQSTEARSEVTSRAHTIDGSNGHGILPLAKAQLDGVLRALEVPFDVNLVQWRITEWSDDGTRGLEVVGIRRSGMESVKEILPQGSQPEFT